MALGVYITFRLLDFADLTVSLGTQTPQADTESGAGTDNPEETAARPLPVQKRDRKSVV